MKKIQIDLITLIAILLIIASLIVGTIAYYNYQNSLCILDPIAYANNYSENYWWDLVTGIKW